MLKIGFLGPKGTFSQEAVKYYLGKLSANLGNNIDACAIEQPFNSIKDIFLSLQNGYLDEAIVPIENSIEGAVNETLDLMASDMALSIKGEVVIPIKQNLLVKEGTLICDIKYILSHPQPIGQCRDFISTKIPHAEVKLVYSTAAAAEIVSNGEYGLKACARFIHCF